MQRGSLLIMSVAAAAAILVLTAAIGALSGLSLGALILRAALGASVFGGLVYGGGLLLLSLIPELEDAESHKGRAVDYVIPSELPREVTQASSQMMNTGEADLGMSLSDDLAPLERSLTSGRNTEPGGLS